MSYVIVKDYLPIKTKRRSGQALDRVGFIVAHDTGNENSTARGNVNYFKSSANTMSASAHTFIDDTQIIECVPLNEKAWHVLYNVNSDNRIYGDDANDIAIGVELCYFSDSNRTREAYKRYVWYLAHLCRIYKLDPLKHITGHHILDPQRKSDPVNALRTIGKTFEDLLQDVQNEFAPKKEVKGMELTLGQQRDKDILVKHGLMAKDYQLTDPMQLFLINLQAQLLRKLEKEGVLK